MSTVKANDIQNATGGIPTVKGQKLIPTAWVNFNGTSTVAIRDSENVSSITDNGTGDYTANFSTDMNDANYSFVLSIGATWYSIGANTQSTSSISVRIYDNSNYNLTDKNIVSVAILGGQA